MGGVDVEEGEAREVGLPAAGAVVDGGVHGAAEVVGGQQVHPAVADDGRGGDSVQHPRQAGPRYPSFGGAAAGTHAGTGAVGGVGEMEQVGPFGVVELQGAGDRVEHGGGHTGDGAAFELGVVLHADPSDGSNLAAAEPRHPAGADVGHARLLRGDLGAPRG